MRNRSCSLFVVLSFCCIAGVAQAGVVEVQGYRSPGEFNRAAWDAEQQRLLAWLVAEQVEEGLAAPVAIKLSEQELRQIELGREVGSQSSPSALLAGVVKPAALTFDLAAPSHGAIARADDGGLVWTAAVHSDDATALRVHFEGFSLPEGFELWVYSMNGIVRGPYTGLGPHGNGDFWSQTVGGSDAVLQLRGHGASAAEQPASFAVTEIGHLGFGAPLKAFCSFNESCIYNGECYSEPAVSEAKDAIAHMQYVKRPYIYFCSGGLLADSAASGTPYFLTANHCISRDREAGTLEAFFQFTIPCGSSACPDYNQISAPSTNGATVLATSKTSDFTLLRLSQSPPNGSAFMGWTTAEVVGTGARLYRISHPGGAPQAYSQHDEWVPPVECSSWPRGQWIYSQDKTGATEGGSSGSPVVNAQGQVVGQLSGGCGYDVYNTCNNTDNSTVDGAFAAYYDQVAQWLGGGGGCVPVAEICDNFIDDDCDGLIDGNDPDCGGGSCLPVGDQCTSNSDCCSGLCHPRKLTCK